MTVPESLLQLKKQLEAVERGDEPLTNVNYTGTMEKIWVDRNLYLVKKGRQSIIDFIIQLEKLITAIELF